ncbi:MAG: molybdopterin guanine dinucleotide-containing S/N-oxide reductase [Alphaproteobacteria bacterium]|nr:molybdopterin guanine dinucleotide-containing S/N-oxide reductase [Alphaproteobacteria bacterium]
MPPDDLFPTTATHWGTYRAEARDGRLVALHPFERDDDPSPIGRSMPGAIDGPLRIRRPMVRRSWLAKREGAGGAGRGSEPFVAVGWDTALDLVAGEIARVRETHGNRAIYAGSYGWASAGRFHHAQSQLRRFLTMAGGFTRSVNAYSYAAAQVIVPRVLGDARGLLGEHTPWPAIAAAKGLVVMFGGMPLKNAQVHAGGVGRHTVREGLQRCKDAGVEFVLVGPIRNDAADFLQAEWLAPIPGTDTALMLGLAHTLVAEGLHDRAFLDRYTHGFERFLPYLMGTADGQAKDAAWASGICGLEAETIRALARRMAARRTLVSVGWSVQRGDHGEQPYWMAITLAAMLGGIGLPGGGFGFGYADINGVGNAERSFPWPALAQGTNRVRDFIPVARISDMLLNPGTEFDFDGGRYRYPDIRMIYWAGGNPFHHHQDLNRLVAAWRRPDTVVVHEQFWNALARHADIVLPATTPFERNDLGCTYSDAFLVAMHRAVDPVGQARCDHDIFADMADRFGLRDAFTEGRDEMGWLRHLYTVARQRGAQLDIAFPDFDAFWEKGWFELPPPDRSTVLLEDYREDPVANRLATPTGRIEIFSPTIAGFAYDDCPGHPVWLEPAERLGGAGADRHPLHLVSNQPDRKLHSQYDHGRFCRDGKVAGREALWIHPRDAAARGIATGDVVRVFNDRGQCLAGAVVTDQVMPRVVQLPTGSWYDPAVPGGLDRHGNPNVLTLDKGTSQLAQAPVAMTCLVEVARWEDEAPTVGIFDPPAIIAG